MDPWTPSSSTYSDSKTYCVCIWDFSRTDRRRVGVSDSSSHPILGSFSCTHLPTTLVATHVPSRTHVFVDRNGGVFGWTFASFRNVESGNMYVECLDK
jgi:hypothetical protein